MLTTERAASFQPDSPDNPTALPLLCDKARARREWGNVSNTTFYEVCRLHEVEIVRIGAKSTVAGTDVARVAAALIAASKQPPIDAKALAAKSVAARKARALASSRRRRPRGSTDP